MFLSRGRNNKNGSIVMAMMVGSVLVLAGVGMWAAQSKLISQTAGAGPNAEAKSIVESVVTRTRSLLAREGVYSTGGCGADTGKRGWEKFAGSVWDFLGFTKSYAAAGPGNIPGQCVICPDLSAFRNFSVTSPSSYAGTWTNPVSTLADAAPPAAGWTSEATLKCLLTDAEAQKLKSITVTITPTGEPDLKTLTRSVRVEVKGISLKPATATLVADQIATRNYLLRVATATNFGVILSPLPSLSPKITIQNALASVEFVSPVFHAGIETVDSSQLSLNIPGMFAGVANSAKYVTFGKPLYIRRPSVDFGQSSFFNPRSGDFKDTFPSGMEVGVLADRDSSNGGILINMLSLPSEPSYSDQWKVWLDYVHGEGATTTMATTMPLPDMEDGIKTAKKGDGSGSVTYLEANAKATFTASPDTVTLPTPLANHPVNKLEDTCLPASAGGVNFAFQQYETNLVLDFNADLIANANAAHTFCGMVAAKKLTIKLPTTGGKFALFGTFIVNEIEITGSGKVFFYNPADGLSPQVALPGGQTQYGLYNQYVSQSGSFMHAFFIPISMRRLFTDTHFGIYMPSKPDLYMGPCVANPTNYYCWKGGIVNLDYSCLYGIPTADVADCTTVTNTSYSMVGYFVEEVF